MHYPVFGAAAPVLCRAFWRLARATLWEVDLPSRRGIEDADGNVVCAFFAVNIIYMYLLYYSLLLEINAVGLVIFFVPIRNHQHLFLIRGSRS
jgi:hypothetical protein